MILSYRRNARISTICLQCVRLWTLFLTEKRYSDITDSELILVFFDWIVYPRLWTSWPNSCDDMTDKFITIRLKIYRTTFQILRITENHSEIEDPRGIAVFDDNFWMLMTNYWKWKVDIWHDLVF